LTLTTTSCAEWPVFICHNRDSLLEAGAALRGARRNSTPITPLPTEWASWVRRASGTAMAGWLIARVRSRTPVRLARPRGSRLGKDDPIALWSGGLSLAYLGHEVEGWRPRTSTGPLVSEPEFGSELECEWLGGAMYLGESASAIEHFERAMAAEPRLIR